jgi:hypothetical protein
VNKQRVARRIEATVAYWEHLSLKQPVRSNWVSSIECVHVDTVCGCTSREELDLARRWQERSGMTKLPVKPIVEGPTSAQRRARGSYRRDSRFGAPQQVAT